MDAILTGTENKNCSLSTEERFIGLNTGVGNKVIKSCSQGTPVTLEKTQVKPVRKYFLNSSIRQFCLIKGLKDETLVSKLVNMEFQFSTSFCIQTIFDKTKQQIL